MPVSDFSSWMKHRYLDWQSEQGEVLPATKFAEYLEVSQQSLSKWMTGRSTPDPDNIQKLADKLGWEVYEALGMQPPITDPRLRIVLNKWNSLPDELRNEIIQSIEQAKETRRDGQRAKKRN